ncbi:ABC transporter ATP-binding protein [Cryobacterium sp. MDB1-18-2]|uniref:ABC transporter ATP-binding protein n=2 Tax=Microbacteriaceae TaxID=85023 RepID=A0ABY2IPA7_9MICO|nr:ABC transporter ATP-binding protein [Cryobacterium sp. MDB2-33-2]TFC19980.1 ABC transporter ATP-binding protein [Cryobacterium glucosi]TFC22907.1 ABC transporter ATP-binding protein [Cryobacterium sp. MDB2-10]TFC34782.1 ABC transporter ATP-binding protein [Cryobacterium sp. MDB1-18-2]TFC38318.1 ABC transporter ATP-binding protein [Cryobacterium sp. MDB1-18-1]
MPFLRVSPDLTKGTFDWIQYHHQQHTIGPAMNQLRDHTVIDAGSKSSFSQRERADQDPMPSHAFRAMALLDVRGLTVATARPGTRGRAATPGEQEVSRVALTLMQGESLALVGESGSGMTATALAIAGLLPPTMTVTNGSILFNGQELVGLSRRAQARLLGANIGYLPPDLLGFLDPTRTILSQLATPLRRRLGLDRPAARARTLKALARVGLDNPEVVALSYPGDLSPVVIQRVAVAAALSLDPELLIAAIPAHARPLADLLRLVRALQSKHQFALILVTDDVGVAAECCERIAVLQAGRIIEQGSVDELLESPQHPHTQRMLDARQPYTLSPADLAPGARSGVPEVVALHSVGASAFYHGAGTLAG